MHATAPDGHEFAPGEAAGRCRHCGRAIHADHDGTTVFVDGAAARLCPDLTPHCPT